MGILGVLRGVLGRGKAVWFYFPLFYFPLALFLELVYRQDMAKLDRVARIRYYPPSGEGPVLRVVDVPFVVDREFHLDTWRDCYCEIVPLGVKSDDITWDVYGR